MRLIDNSLMHNSATFHPWNRWMSTQILMSSVALPTSMSSLWKGIFSGMFHLVSTFILLTLPQRSDRVNLQRTCWSGDGYPRIMVCAIQLKYQVAMLINPFFCIGTVPATPPKVIQGDSCLNESYHPKKRQG